MLSLHQEEKVSQGVELLAEQGILLVKGSAGTGKTYSAESIIERLLSLLSKEATVLCTAPTNKAVAVLRQGLVRRPNQRIETTHRALKLKFRTNEETGELEFFPDYTNVPLEGQGVLLVDEASMLPTKLLDYIEDVVVKAGWYLIFLGDEKQLPPPKETTSSVFHRNYPEVELTEPRRNAADSPVLQLSMNLDLLDSPISNMLDDGSGYFYTRFFPEHISPSKRIVEKLAEVNGSDELKYLAYTNDNVDAINTKVRNLIYGKPNRVEIGEHLVFSKPYKDYYTSEEVQVESIRTTDMWISYSLDKRQANSKALIKCYVVNEDFGEPIVILHEDSDRDFAKLTAAVNQAAKHKKITYTEANIFKNTLAKVTYAHALTIHKSQGSTYQDVILNVKDIKKYTRNNLSDRQKLLYTGVTRAANLLILYNT